MYLNAKVKPLALPYRRPRLLRFLVSLCSPFQPDPGHPSSVAIEPDLPVIFRLQQPCAAPRSAKYENLPPDQLWAGFEPCDLRLAPSFNLEQVEKAAIGNLILSKPINSNSTYESQYFIIISLRILPFAFEFVMLIAFSSSEVVSGAKPCFIL